MRTCFLEAFADNMADASDVGTTMMEMGAGAVEVTRPGDLSARWRVRGCFDVTKIDATKTTPPGFTWLPGDDGP